MSESVNVTKDSIQIPYRRFLSDSAAGLAAILLGIGAYYRPLLGTPLNRVLAIGTVGSQVKVFSLLLLFLLATPIGFAVNAISWFIFGQAIAYIERMCARLGAGDAWLFPIEDVAGSRCTAFIRGELPGNEMTFDHLASLLREVLDMPQLARLCPETQVRGLVYFLRNLGLFASIIGFARLASAQVHPVRSVVLALLIVLTLTMRWNWIARKPAFIKWIAAGVMLAATFFSVYGTTFSASSAWCMVASVALVLLAGLVGFYNGCDILLHWYIAGVALGGLSERLASSPDQIALMTAAKMLEVAGQRSNAI
jgi:hypothetical protein